MALTENDRNQRRRLTLASSRIFNNFANVHSDELRQPLPDRVSYNV